jgi:hypothetical protein
VPPTRFANPFSDGKGQWFRGNIHTHFLCLTDHEKASDPAGLSKEGFLVFTGIETGSLQTRHHIVGIGVRKTGPFTKQETPQETIAELRSMGALVSIAHPYWSALTLDDVRDLKEIIGVELYNTGCEVEIGRGFSTVHWDNLLASGMALNGLAVDDAHRYTDDAPGGWVWVRAPRLTQRSILAAISKGHFYSTTGPRIEEILVDGDTVQVTCSPVHTITFHSRGPSGNSVHRVGEGILTHAARRFKPEHQYVRIECVDCGGRKAWSNPIYTEMFGR